MSRPIKRRHVDHQVVAVLLQSKPGVWMEVGEYLATHTADGTAHRIRTGYNAPMYRPAGAFEARTKLTEFGTIVEARYVDGASSVKPASRVRPSLETERVLGQIERGEIWCGPSAARAIAARHEEAYGSAFGRPSAADIDAAWADALAGLTSGSAE